MFHVENPQQALVLVSFVLGFISGMTIPLRYGMERLNGFSRWVVSKLPYRAPPGKSPEKALEDATDEKE